MIARFIARPRHDPNSYPWRPMDNREKRSSWSQRYYLLYKPYGHGEAK